MHSSLLIKGPVCEVGSAGTGFVALLVLAGMACFGVVRSAQATEVVLTAAEQAFIQANPVLRVANEKAWPPFNFNGSAPLY